jgi:predicted lysophospholipase L1 biosynthesis ABC-type transport system permease subunit
VLAASLGHLLNTPGLAGFTWDAFVSAESGCPKPPPRCEPTRRSPATAGAASPACASARSGPWRWCSVARDRPGQWSQLSLASIAGLPVALSGLLALMAAATLAHTLASSTRRRRRDVAILKSLGFGRWQLRQAVAWQATTIAGIALLVGLPAGVAGGRWAWRYLATQLGVLPEPAVPLTAIVIAIPAALVVANLIAAAPGQAAARIPPAAVLRTE